MFFYSYDDDYTKIKKLLPNDDSQMMKKLQTKINEGETEDLYLFDENEVLVAFLWMHDNILEWLDIDSNFINQKKIEGLFNFCIKEAKHSLHSSILIYKEITCIKSFISEFGQEYSDQYFRVEF